MRFNPGDKTDVLLVTGISCVYDALVSAFPGMAILEFPVIEWTRHVVTSSSPKRYERYVLVAEGFDKKERAEYTAAALELAEAGYSVNVFAWKGRSSGSLDKKLRFTLSLPPIPKGSHGDGFKVLPGGFRNTVRRVSLDTATETLMAAFREYTPGKRLVIAIDTGGGKTTTLARSFQSLPLSPALFLSPTLKLSEDFLNEFSLHNIGLGAIFRGRNLKLCHMSEEVQKLGAARRSINANLCQTCIHGLSTMADLGSESALEKIESLENKGVDFSWAKECGYILQMYDVRKYPMVVAAEASLAGTPKHLLEFWENSVKDGAKNAEEKKPRTIIWDDCFTPFSEVSLTAGDVDLWLSRARKTLSNPNASSEQIEWVERLEPLLFSLAETLKNSAGNATGLPLPVNSLPMKGFSTWKEAGYFMSAVPMAAKAKDGAIVEKIEGVGGEREVPVRAISDLGKALSLGSAWIDRGKLRFQIPTLSLELFSAQGGIVLDATPSPFVRELADEVIEIRIEQPNLYIEMDASLFRGRTGLREPEAAAKAAQYLEDLCLRVCESGVAPEDLAVITHKPIEMAIVERSLAKNRGISFPKIGHWGAHERGHNDYKTSKVLILDGVPVPPPDVCFTAYETSRLWLEYAKGGDLKGWSSYSPERVKKTLSLPMKHGVASIKAYVSDNDDVAGWLRETVTASLVQAVGRLRAVRRRGEDLRIIVCTSFPLSSSYGLEIHSVVGDSVLWGQVTKLRNEIRAYRESQGSAKISFLQKNLSSPGLFSHDPFVFSLPETGGTLRSSAVVGAGAFVSRRPSSLGP